MKENFQNQVKSLGRLLLVFGLLLMITLFGFLYVSNNPDVLQSDKKYEELPLAQVVSVELDAATIAKSGFVDDDGVASVIQNCTQCHSAKLVTQNRLSREGWEATIDWMQKTQNLWDLGANQEKIVSYLAKNYGAESKGRRQNLTHVEWYVLE